ncbi:alpha-1,6-mannosyl-glycoprotein 2-beta-N-acetylglucosaminyltransferase-like [Gigantopelta aegis]|uniref:alpha-1,6-mannosyl-glycoprotein 2-beta-N-acetylglucosaminyltransferase-like n=1 Tax=Gigantopelta aegis TaxID=1735272 RepID=UPI001B888057|nr:alpha-1,6-mannosyl-glycoprotein 2-beta-N-acetylglucosaminyltransferase-like [Gigantopelta aegis]
MTRYSGNSQADDYLPAKPESSGSDAVKLDSQESITHRNASLFMPDWKDVETFRRDVQFLNQEGFIHNAQTFKPKLTSESIVILVQVHNRPDQLQILIDSFHKMRYINETLVIFSHDFYSQDLFDVIAKIDFCPYMQIFYPYAIQVYNSQFPGTDPNDCPRNLQKDESRKRKCNNAEYQDFYGQYRGAPYTQIKHHFLWKLQFIFENCSLFRTFEGLIFRIEEDYYLAEDTIDYMRKLDRQARIQCPEFKMYIMGEYSGYSHEEYKSSATRKDRWYIGIGTGMAFRKYIWKLFKECAKSFCLFDDYNWDWSLMHVAATCIRGGFKILKPKGSRARFKSEFRVESSHSGLDATIQQSLDSIGDTSRQEPPGTVHVQANDVFRHHNKIAILFASIFVIKRCQLPGLHQLFKVDEGLSAQILCVAVFALLGCVLNDHMVDLS